MINVGILSNSFGEDRSGALIGRELKRISGDISILAFPLISFGGEYTKRKIKVVGGSSPPPSGGFFLRKLSDTVRDMVEYFSLPFLYIKRLNHFKDCFDIVIIIGDVPLLLMEFIALRKKAYLLAPCKSDWMNPHFFIEELLIRRLTEKIFTHDELTAENMCRRGVNAIFLGNPMMDGLKGEDIYKPPTDKILIGILPGSRKESYLNLKRIGRVIDILSKERNDVTFAVALAGTVSRYKMKKIIDNVNSEVELVSGGFVDILRNSRIIISLAGTASEQAVGIGKPVISFPGEGSQTTRKRLYDQKKLLGKAFIYMEYNPKEISCKIQNILDNKEFLNEVTIAGPERLGVAGGARRIAEFILESESIN